MLSSVLRSNKAIKVNIAIMRAFVRMRDLIDENKELKKRLDAMENKFDKQFSIVFDAIRQMIEKKEEPRKLIGILSPAGGACPDAFCREVRGWTVKTFVIAPWNLEFGTWNLGLYYYALYSG
jgi:hypothetical protein